MINAPTIQPQRRLRFDILRVPLLGKLLTWKHSRTLFQVMLFTLAAAIIIDGLFGSPLAPRNVATVSAWVHYRGLVVLALLLFGNLFCAACPFVLPRKLAKWLGKPTRRWPKALRNKWLALLGLVGIIYTYELFDLWASPWWTAWLAIAYFATAFVLEAFFTRSSFCMYVCPLGTFNFLYSAVSPTQITSRDLDTCRDCEGHECINGTQDGTQDGCQLELFVPTIESNMNCTLCLDCVRACPYDNVALAVRPPGDELFRQTWRNRLDLAWLAIIAACIGLVNAFGIDSWPTRVGLWRGVDRAADVRGQDKIAQPRGPALCLQLCAHGLCSLVCPLSFSLLDRWHDHCTSFPDLSLSHIESVTLWSAQLATCQPLCAYG